MTGAGHAEIEHTADLGFDVWAPGLGELLAEATRALTELCYERAEVRPAQSRRLLAEGQTDEELLVSWLQEVYFLVEAEGWLTAVAEQVEVASGRASGLLRGEPLDRERHLIHTEIKAVTYHDLRIERGVPGLLRARLIVDV